MKGNPYHAKDGLDSFFYIFNEYGKLKDSYLTISNLRTKHNKDIRGDSLVWEKVKHFNSLSKSQIISLNLICFNFLKFILIILIHFNSLSYSDLLCDAFDVTEMLPDA